MQHLVKQNVLDNEWRHARAVHPPVQHHLVRARIVATELPAPTPGAPADVRPLKFAGEILAIQPIEECVEVVVPSLRRS